MIESHWGGISWQLAVSEHAPKDSVFIIDQRKASLISDFDQYKGSDYLIISPVSLSREQQIAAIVHFMEKDRGQTR